MASSTKTHVGVACALSLVLLTWAPPTLIGNPRKDAYVAFLGTPVFLFSVVGVLLVGIVVGSMDRWLGAAILWMGLLSAKAGTDLAASTATWFAIGAGAVAILHGLPPRYRTLVVYLLVGSAALEVGHAALQVFGRVDPILPYWGAGQPVGTFGNPRYLGAFVALAVPLAPLWLLPVLAIGLILSQSWLATLAAIVGLVVKGGGSHHLRGLRKSWTPSVQLPDGQSRYLTAAPFLMFGGGAVLGALVYLRGLRLDNLWGRLEAWRLGWDTWCSPLFGCGPGGWLTVIPAQQMSLTGKTNELFLQAHSEPIQWVYETGLVGLVLLIGWLWTVRSKVRPAWRGSFYAAAVLSLGLHILHWPTLAPMVLLVLGLGIGDKSVDDRE